MATRGKLIYIGFKGKMSKVAEPTRPSNVNFVIQFDGLDWSGFRTLAQCEKQFPELEKGDADRLDRFSVIEV